MTGLIWMVKDYEVLRKRESVFVGAYSESGWRAVVLEIQDIYLDRSRRHLGKSLVLKRQILKQIGKEQLKLCQGIIKQKK